MKNKGETMRIILELLVYLIAVLCVFYYIKTIKQEKINKNVIIAYALYLDAIGIDWNNGNYRIYLNKRLAIENEKIEKDRLFGTEFPSPYKIVKVKIEIENN